METIFKLEIKYKLVCRYHELEMILLRILIVLSDPGKSIFHKELLVVEIKEHFQAKLAMKASILSQTSISLSIILPFDQAIK